ncbi:MAG TPA: type II secretion protein F, partial [Propionibacteriaceae bacterium]|nr:type II secretion protein F [Propionibacteriaceae bacterium]
MSGVLAITAGLLIIGGLLGIVSGSRRQTPRASSRRSESTVELWARITRRPTGRRGRRRDLILVLSVIIGCVAAAVTGWLILIVVLPILAIGLPYLLILPKPRDVELLEALDR